MKTWKNAIAECLASIALIVCLITSESIPACLAEKKAQDDTQSYAIAMLNYITVLTQEINASKYNRLYLEEAYSSLINNLNIDAVKDERTINQLDTLLKTMQNYRMVNIKRERLHDIYEQNQAQEIRAAIPNPLGMLAAIQTMDMKGIIAAIVYMAVDSVTSYTSHTSEIELQYLKDDMILEDEADAELDISRRSAFNYMLKIANKHRIPTELTLTEETITDFVDWKNDDNVAGRIQFLLENQKTYQFYGGYWLVLAKSYYEIGDYKKSLEAFDTYEAINVPIFRKDYDFAQILPLAISASEEVLSDKDYINKVSHYAQSIIDNTKNTDWSLRFFAAKTFVDLASKAQDKAYLQKAYNITLNNINNYLAKEQERMNDSYFKPIDRPDSPEKPVKKQNEKKEEYKKRLEEYKAEKKRIEQYEEVLEQSRKTELPPVSEALLLNCDLLFALANELDISEYEQSRVDSIIHPNNKALFLSKTLDEKYWFNYPGEKTNTKDIDIEFEGDSLILPVVYLTDQASVKVTVSEKSTNQETLFNDWEIIEVQRINNDDISTYRAVYKSKLAEKYAWKPGTNITIEVITRENAGLEDYRINYFTKGTKEKWYDYFKFWEGHKNEWYDYAKVWENSVVFERIA